jgi:hypothetical protein
MASVCLAAWLAVTVSISMTEAVVLFADAAA